MSGLYESRRLRVAALMAALGAAVVGLVAGPLGAALPSSKKIAFEVFRDGSPLGRHDVVFHRDGRDLHVNIDIELEVKLAFLTVFRYSHVTHEVWRDGRLVAIESKTDDDGESFWMRGEATQEGLQIEGTNGSLLAPADILPTSYWNPLTVRQRQLLDSQNGRLITVEVQPGGTEIVPFAGRTVLARRYRMDGDITLDLWYTADGEWAKTAFEARGAEVAYARQGAASELAEIEGPDRDR